jgi:hypothetical protein
VQDTIKSAISSGHGNAIVYAGAIGLLLSDVIPTPADGVYFWLMKKERDKYDKKEITAKQYWTREAMAYYGLNPIWWGIVLGVLYYTKGDYTNKLKVGVGLISAGAVAGVLYKNIKEDETTKAI